MAQGAWRQLRCLNPVERPSTENALHSEEVPFCRDFFDKTGCYFDGIKWFVYDPLLSRNR
jgi:hypothetical protein